MSDSLLRWWYLVAEMRLLYHKLLLLLLLKKFGSGEAKEEDKDIVGSFAGCVVVMVVCLSRPSLRKVAEPAHLVPEVTPRSFVVRRWRRN